MRSQEHRLDTRDRRVVDVTDLVEAFCAAEGRDGRLPLESEAEARPADAVSQRREEQHFQIHGRLLGDASAICGGAPAARWPGSGSRAPGGHSGSRRAQRRHSSTSALRASAGASRQKSGFTTVGFRRERASALAQAARTPPSGSSSPPMSGSM